MITREQVADLHEGDVVELGFASGAIVRGPLVEDRHTGCLQIDDVGWKVRSSDGSMAYGIERYVESLTVVSRAPRPLYVNHPRTEPVEGDVIRVDFPGSPDDACVNVYAPDDKRPDKPWLSVRGDIGVRYSTPDVMPQTPDIGQVSLVVDGETGQVVP